MNPNTCPNYVDCPTPSTSPLSGYNAETSETIQYLARGFGPSVPAPLNWIYDQPFAYSIGNSSVSQAAAQQTAVAKAIADAQETWQGPGMTPDIEPDDSDVISPNSLTPPLI